MKKTLLLIILINFCSCIEYLSDKELIETYQESYDNQNWSKALSCLKEGLKRTPTDTALYFNNAYCLNNLNKKKHNKEVISNLDVYLIHFKTSIKGRLLKYSNLYDNEQYYDAISELEIIEKYYGISPNTLILKANAHFLNREYENAAFYYEEFLGYQIPIESFKSAYYYKIYSKYFAGNIEGAQWDTAFLEDYGFKMDRKLMELIINKQLDINNYNSIPFTTVVKQFEKGLVPKVTLEYNLLYRPSYSSQLFKTPKKKVADLNTLDSEITLLNLSGNNIYELPNDIKKFNNLKAINLSRNKIKDFDKLFNQLAALDSLEYLALNYSNLKDFPSSVQKLKNLKGLSMEASNIRRLPPEIGNLKNLSYLNVGGNGKLTDLPKEIKYLKNLNAIDVSGSGMKRLRNELSLCYNLMGITANASNIVTIPKDIGNLKHLSFVNLSSNKIEELPKSLGDVTYLNQLSLGSNEIKEVPTSVKNLEYLNILSLEFNRFQEFPKEVLKIKNLQTLWLHNNNVPSIPLEIAKMEELTHLLIDHEIIKNENINQIKKINPELYVIREDTRKYVGGRRRKN